MVKLELTMAEQEILAEVLDSALSDLRMEIADTDSYDFRQGLKGRKAVLQKVLDVMGEARPAVMLA